MTLQEIKERIAAYESKWGKLGHTNIMKPENEIQHSALNERRNTMIKTTNDFYKFRQKVAIGKEANKLAHKATISPEELNERNFQNQIDNNTLIHASRRGNEREDHKYYRKEDVNGKPRYFYSQEEYDAYKRGDQTTPNVAPGIDNKGKQNAGTNDYKQRSQASEDFNRENDERWAYEVSKNRKSGNDNWEREMLANEKGKQMDKDLKYVDSLKKDVSEGVRDVIHDHKNPVGKLMDYIEDAFEDDELRMDKNGNMTGDEKVIAKIQEMSKEAEKYGKNLGNNLGEEGGKKVWDEFQKQTGDRVSKLTRAYNVKDEALKAYDENGEDGVADYLLGTDEWKKIEKEVRKAIGDGKLRFNRDKSGFNNLSKDEEELLDDLYEEIDGFIDIIGDGTGINRKAISDLLGNELINFAASHSETKYETNSNGKDNYNTGDKKFVNTNKETKEYQDAQIRKIIENSDRMRENSRKNNGSRSVYGKDNNPERDRYAKHSSFDDEREIPSYIGASDIRAAKEESIMSEYRAFKARANKGAEKNRLSHSAVISPRDLNAKYEEELMKEYIAIHPEEDDDIEHSSNGRAYINKIDKYYPDGSARYFYTQAEWDAYQEGLKRSQYEANKKAQESENKISAYNAKKEADSRNNMSGYADYKKAQSAKAEADSRNNMSGYGDFKKAQNAKTEANSRNDMGGYKDWKEGQEAKKSAQAKLDEMNKSAQENEAKKLASQKAEASRRSGMDDYDEYLKEQKEEEYKTRAKQKAGMEGYAAYNKAKEAKNEADSRNDMSGYNQWKEDTAKAKKEADQKTEAAKRSGMEGYEQYQQDKKTEAQKADIAKRQDMEGYEEWKKEQDAEKEANAKKVAEDRNDMSGYAAWKRRRDYINNQKKASEAADAAEAEKHEIEKKAVKNSTEVTKNKAAAKAQEDAENEKHEAESAKRIAEERAGASKRYDDAKNAAMKAGQESAAKLIAENEARDKEHEADKAKRINREKIDNLHNNANKIIHDTAKKYDQQIDAYNAVLEKMKDKTSPDAKEIKDKIEKAYIEKDTALAREIETIIEDIGEVYSELSDKNSPEAQALKGEAYSILLRNDAGFRTTETAKKKLAGAKTKYDTIFR